METIEISRRSFLSDLEGEKKHLKIENVRDRTRSVRHNSVVRYQEVGRLTARRESHTNITTLVGFYCSTRKLYRSYV